MRKALFFIAVAALLLGAFQVVSAYSFVSKAARVQGTVYAVERLPGPPKPRQKIPVHVSYEFQGRPERGEVRMPMLGSLSQGDAVPLWVQADEPGRPVLAEPSAIFATPLTILVCGFVGVVLTSVLRRKAA